MSVVQQQVNDSIDIALSEAAINHLLMYLKGQTESKGVRFSVKKRVALVYLMLWITSGTLPQMTSVFPLTLIIRFILIEKVIPF